MAELEDRSSFSTVILGFRSKEKEEEYKYFYFSNIFTKTRTVIFITSVIYFLLGVFDVLYNDIDVGILTSIKFSVSAYGFILALTNVMKIESNNLHVILFYFLAALGVVYQTFLNNNEFFYLFYSAGLLSIISVVFLLSGVKFIYSLLMNLIIVTIFLGVVNLKLFDFSFYGYLTLLTMGIAVGSVASFLNELSSRENYRLLKLVEITTNEKLSKEIANSQGTLKKLEELNVINKHLRIDINSLISKERELRDYIDNKNISQGNKFNALIKSVDDIAFYTDSISNKISTISNKEYNIDEIKKANVDLSKMLYDIKLNVNNNQDYEIAQEHFEITNFLKEIGLIYKYSENYSNLIFSVANRSDDFVELYTDQIKLKQIFISLLNYLANQNIKDVKCSYSVKENNLISFNIEYETLLENLNIKGTLVSTYLLKLGGAIIEAKTNESVFAFEIPISLKQEKSSGTDKDFNNKSVLIIDDDNENLSYIEYVINKLNAKIYKATDGSEAINLFKKYNKELEIVIMDVNMPGINGDEAAKFMKEINPDVPILLVTAYSYYKNKLSNGDKVIIKPFSPKVLIDNILELVN